MYGESIPVETWRIMGSCTFTSFFNHYNFLISEIEKEMFPRSHVTVLSVLGGFYLDPPSLLHPVCLFHLSCCLFSLWIYVGLFSLSVNRQDKYNLFEHNCNVFSNELAQFLTGRKIPSYITDLPSDILSTWVRSVILCHEAGFTPLMLCSAYSLAKI